MGFEVSDDDEDEILEYELSKVKRVAPPWREVVSIMIGRVPEAEKIYY